MQKQKQKPFTLKKNLWIFSHNIINLIWKYKKLIGKLLFCYVILYF